MLEGRTPGFPRRDPWLPTPLPLPLPALGPDTDRDRARALLHLYVAGAALGLLTLLLPIPPAFDALPLLIAVAAAVGVILVLLLRPERVGPRALHGLLAFATACITLVAATSGVPSAGYTPFLYWILLYAGRYLRPGAVAGHTVLVVLSLGVAVHAAGDAAGVLVWVHGSVAMGLTVAVVHRVRTRVEALFAELTRLAATDGLTGLGNRASFEAALARESARSTRSGRPAALLFCDIDHFKQINDRHGHTRGDAVLANVAALLRCSRHRAAECFRLGGEEFAVLLPDTDGAGASLIAEHLRMLVGAAEPAGVPVTMSVGVATTEAQPRPDPHQLLRAADAAMYMAKKHGRNRVMPSLVGALA